MKRQMFYLLLPLLYCFRKQCRTHSSLHFTSLHGGLSPVVEQHHEQQPQFLVTHRRAVVQSIEKVQEQLTVCECLSRKVHREML